MFNDPVDLREGIDFKSNNELSIRVARLNLIQNADGDMIVNVDPSLNDVSIGQLQKALV
jgi:hypothetical protein